MNLNSSSAFEILLFVILLLSLVLVSNSLLVPDESTVSSSQPNIILFMTDDQDVTADSLEYMPKLNQLFGKEGTKFLHYYVPTGLCCPSRATILRGQYCHNTEIYDNGELTNSTYQSGGWTKFLDTGLEKETMATMLQSAGYETVLIGKYMNKYMGGKAAKHKPPGFDHWMGMLKVFNFYDTTFSDNGKFMKIDKNVHQTDFIRDWVIDFLTSKRDASKPFFLMITPFAPHAPAIPAKRHENMFADVEFPRHDSFNPPDDVQKNFPVWIKNLPPLTQEQIDQMDKFYRNRLRSLQGIDEALESLVNTLRDSKLEDNTYFFYTSDNGQHFGDYRIPAGKRQAYDTDILVPFFVRGPGIKKGAKVTQVVQSVDLAPTFLDLASYTEKQSSSYEMDGKSMVPLLFGDMEQTPDVNDYRWAALIEMYGGSSNMGLQYKNMTHFIRHKFFPNTYQAVRIVNGPNDWEAYGANWLYVEWCTGEIEFYDVDKDPHQIKNIADTVDIDLLYKLNKLVAKLGDCRGSECYNLNTLVHTHKHKHKHTHKHIHPHKTHDDGGTVASSRKLQSLWSLKKSIQKRLLCHNSPNFSSSSSSVDVSVGRKEFAMHLSVPEPFTTGFPFSDGDSVPDDMLSLWAEYEHYFH